MLNSRFWKKFLVSDIFDVRPTKTYSLLTSKIINNQGKVPVLSSTGLNNGIAGYTDLEPTEQGNIITYSDTTGGTSTMFYQKLPFVGCCHVQGLFPKLESLKVVFNEDIALFFISVIQSALGFDWSYGNKLTRKKLQSSFIYLPVVDDANLDWQFMIQYIIQIKDNYLLDIKKELNIIVISDESENNDFYKNKEFREFFIKDLFESQTGDVDLQQKDVNGKGYYLINSGIKDTGIKGKTDKEARIFSANTLTLDFLGNVFYRDYEYKMATHNHVFSLSSNIIVDEDVGLYLVTSLQYLKDIFSFDNMCTWNKVKNLKMLLPICQKESKLVIDNELKYHAEDYFPDIHYMRNYIIYIKNKLLIEYKNNLHFEIRALGN